MLFVLFKCFLLLALFILHLITDLLLLSWLLLLWMVRLHCAKRFVYKSLLETLIAHTWQNFCGVRKLEDWMTCDWKQIFIEITLFFELLYSKKCYMIFCIFLFDKDTEWIHLLDYILT